MIDEVLGLGCDILEVKRLEEMLRKGHDDFIKRLLTPVEIAEYESRAEKSAIRIELYNVNRYSAKEAFSNAMNTVIRQVCSGQALSVLNLDSGQLILFYSERFTLWIESRRALAEVSISGEQNYA